MSFVAALLLLCVAQDAISDRNALLRAAQDRYPELPINTDPEAIGYHDLRLDDEPVAVEVEGEPYPDLYRAFRFTAPEGDLYFVWSFAVVHGRQFGWYVLGERGSESLFQRFHQRDYWGSGVFFQDLTREDGGPTPRLRAGEEYVIWFETGPEPMRVLVSLNALPRGEVIDAGAEAFRRRIADIGLLSIDVRSHHVDDLVEAQLAAISELCRDPANRDDRGRLDEHFRLHTDLYSLELLGPEIRYAPERGKIEVPETLLFRLPESAGNQLLVRTHTLTSWDGERMSLRSLAGERTTEFAERFGLLEGSQRSLLQVTVRIGGTELAGAARPDAERPVLPLHPSLQVLDLRCLMRPRDGEAEVVFSFHTDRDPLVVEPEGLLLE